MIKVENLSKTYKLDNGEELSALKNINLEVNQGEILGIIGMSGSGKTSLLRILRGVEKFDEGKVTLDDIEVSHDSSQYYYNKLRTATAIHLQRSFGLWPETAINNVIRKLYGVKYGDEADINLESAEAQYGEEAMEILRIVGLEDKAEHFAPVLSGGEKQRLIMARQLAKKPKVLLLDEPATMACPKTKQAILDSIKRINEDLGVTVVLVSHLPEVHNYLADRVILLKDGQIAEEGDPKTVTDDFLGELDPEVEMDSTVDDLSILKANNLEKKFFLLKGGNVLEIEDINIEVKKRDILTILGPSGAGKTILLRMLAGLDYPEEGEVYYYLDSDGEVDDSEPNSNSKSNSDEEKGVWVDLDEPGINRMKVRRKVGFMYQEFALQHHSTIRDQLATKLGFKNQFVVDEARKRAKELELGDELLDALYQLTDLPESEAKSRLEQIGLLPDILDELFPKFPEKAVKEEVKPLFEALDLPLDIINRKSYELSGGQKVRAMLALALASKPETLFLDEPFGDLDPITLRIVSNSIKKINKEFNTTIIMVSHNIDFIKELSKRAIFMDEGKIIDDGNPVKLADDFVEFCKADYLLDN
ncbi:ATP-binding cassette domain-containing protein [Methanobrevibacter sp. TMH8]|uniref:ATP-binding cassette domain-containing protein n=1 Tax=Methanobrevibacter sp. TMH8 TaxID=2848611 RepID=UPI001CCDB5B4|nr:ATP-binding cassette domain-containing protein [Methanobrevibacter sp. TMH8]MBZ9570865.1 ATP-binding cassette domain-containing protein [Methanobrevibacter sp. TMH8]